MKEYVIFTDSSCDLPCELVAEWGIQVLSLEVTIDGVGSFLNHEIEPAKFYEYLRDKCPVKTSAANMDKFCEAGIVWTGENLSYHTNILFNDERWMRIFRIACERHLIVQLHNAPEVEYVAKTLPDLTIVGSHLNPDVIPHLVDYPNVYIDISGMHGGVVRGHLRRAKGLFGAERLLFGTDYPGYDVLPFIEICKRDLSIEEQEKIFAGNLLGLLKKHGASCSGVFAL